MKKNDLKASLGRIRPREELINSTLANIAEQKERQQRRVFVPSYSFNMRLAGAVCALLLVFGLGFVIARQEINKPDVRTLGQLEQTEAITDGISMLSLDDELENGWILIKGNINSMIFADLTSADAENGAIRRCKVNITANGLIERSETLSVDLDKSSADFEADVVFYDNDAMNTFFDLSTGEMIFRLTPGDDGAWIIIEFSSFEK